MINQSQKVEGFSFEHIFVKLKVPNKVIIDDWVTQW